MPRPALHAVGILAAGVIAAGSIVASLSAQTVHTVGGANPTSPTLEGAMASANVRAGDNCSSAPGPTRPPT